METGTPIRLNHTDWQDPEVHARRALEVLDELERKAINDHSYVPGNSSSDLVEARFEELREEIENLYHSFYVR